MGACYPPPFFDESDSMSISHQVERAARLPTVLRVEFESRGALVAAYLTNLSKGGLLLRTESPVSVGDELNLVVSVLGFHPPIEARGAVRWVSREDPNALPSAGLEFVQMQPEHRARLDRLLMKLNEMSGGAVKGPLPERGMRLLLLEAHPLLRDVFKFEVNRLAAARGWNIEIVSVEHDDDYRSAVTSGVFGAAIIDLDEFNHSARELVGILRSTPGHRRAAVVMLSRQMHPEMEEFKNDTMFLRKPVSIQALVGILGLVGTQNLEGEQRGSTSSPHRR